MHISIDWIRDFVNLPEISPTDLATKLTLSTAEVEGVHSEGDYLKKIKVVEIVSIRKHPEADKLNLVTFKKSESENFEVVCGASNVRVGLKVPYAPVGIKLPNGMVLEPKKIRGVLSSGMLCSQEELGIQESSDGLMELSSDAPIGQTMLEYLNQSAPTILEIDNKSLTHRPDLWGHFGMAREFATIFKTPLKDRFDVDFEKKIKSLFNTKSAPITPTFEGDSAGICYYGLSVDNVTVGPSPKYIKNRLESVGLRSINNIVDISNYVMLELGIPLHIFDRNKISGSELVIKELGSAAKFTTLDGVERELIASDTVICDQSGPLVLAGIMGGLSSGVDDQTRNIFIEVANWKAPLVRKSSTRLGLRTDSSMRYEKSLDSSLCKRTLYRTLELVEELCPNASVVGAPLLAGTDTPSKTVTVTTSAKRISTHLGKEVLESEIIRILSSLGFLVQNQGGELSVTAPSYRATKDVECEADLFEEIGRMVGFDNITPVSPLVSVKPIRLTNSQKIGRDIRDFFVSHVRAYEIMTYPMVGEKLLKKFSWPISNELKIINALSHDHDQMRPSLIPTHLMAACENAKYYSEFRFFELGRSYHKSQNNFATEKNMLSVLFYDKEVSPFTNLVSVLERLSLALNFSLDFFEPNQKFKNEFLPEGWHGVHPYEVFHIRAMGKIVGQVFSLHPSLASEIKLRGFAALAQIDLTLFENAQRKDKTRYQPLPKFQSSTFDWSVVLPKSAAVGTVMTLFKKLQIRELTSVKVLDLFDLPNGERSLTIRAHLQDAESTLLPARLEEIQSILTQTTEKQGFMLRK